MNEFSIYLQCILNDVELQYGRLTLCDLRHYNVRGNFKKPYQIWCDDQNHKHFEMFDKPEKAVVKFLELKAKIKYNIRSGNKNVKFADKKL